MPAGALQLGHPLDDQPAGRRAGLVRHFGFGMQPLHRASAVIMKDRLMIRRDSGCWGTVNPGGS